MKGDDERHLVENTASDVDDFEEIVEQMFRKTPFR
jgi:hypothetical protein